MIPPDPKPGVYASLAELVALQFKARGFSFLPRQPIHSLLAGRHASRLRGRGLNFEEIRRYQPGDDVRQIDWKATVRTRKTQFRVYSEERERSVILLVDQRITMFFGSVQNMKSVTAAEAAALATWRVLSQKDRIGALDRLVAESGTRPAEGAIVPQGTWFRWACTAVSWIAVVVAMARPQIIEQPLTKTVPVRDVLLAVDLSGSMETQDFTDAQGKNVDRLTAVKEVFDDFLAKRKGDRVGLIFFGSAPFVQAPFTEDLKVCRELLEDAQVNMAGPQTAFGDAIGLAITVFERSPVKDRVLIALTDGNDTASKVPPAKAAEIAKDKGIIIHTVAVGDPQAAGEDALDVAANREQLEEIYHKLDQLETRKAETISHRPRRDVYWWPLAAGLAISMLQHGLQLAKDRPRARPSSSEPNSDLRERERRTRKNERVTV